MLHWRAPPGRRGTRAIGHTHLRVAGPEALDWWRDHLRKHGVTTGEVEERDGRLTLNFEDPEGQRLALADDQGIGETHGSGPAPAGSS